MNDMNHHSSFSNVSKIEVFFFCFYSIIIYYYFQAGVMETLHFIYGNVDDYSKYCANKMFMGKRKKTLIRFNWWKW